MSAQPILSPEVQEDGTRFHSYTRRESRIGRRKRRRRGRKGSHTQVAKGRKRRAQEGGRGVGVLQVRPPGEAKGPPGT